MAGDSPRRCGGPASAGSGLSAGFEHLAGFDRGVADGLEDLDLVDVGDGADHGGQLGVGALGDHPGVDLAAGEGLDLVGRRAAGERLAELGERGQHHVGAHRRELHVVGQRRADLHDAAAAGHLGQVERRLGGLLGAASTTSRSRTRPFRRSISAFGSICSSPLSSIASTAADSASRHSSSTSIAVAGQAALALAQELEDVLHLVRQRGHAGEAHRRAHALQGVRDAEDLVDRLLVVRALLDPDDRQVELLEVLTALGQEHGEVFRDVHLYWLFR